MFKLVFIAFRNTKKWPAAPQKWVGKISELCAIYVNQNKT